jgi:hypothetical protein
VTADAIARELRLRDARLTVEDAAAQAEIVHAAGVEFTITTDRACSVGRLSGLFETTCRSAELQLEFLRTLIPVLRPEQLEEKIDQLLADVRDAREKGEAEFQTFMRGGRA